MVILHEVYPRLNKLLTSRVAEGRTVRIAIGDASSDTGQAGGKEETRNEDPSLEPTVHIHSQDEHVIPYAITSWFMEQVAEQVERCRLAFE